MRKRYIFRSVRPLSVSRSSLVRSSRMRPVPISRWRHARLSPPLLPLGRLLLPLAGLAGYAVQVLVEFLRQRVQRRQIVAGEAVFAFYGYIVYAQLQSRDGQTILHRKTLAEGLLQFSDVGIDIAFRQSVNLLLFAVDGQRVGLACNLKIYLLFAMSRASALCFGEQRYALIHLPQ